MELELQGKKGNLALCLICFREGKRELVSIATLGEKEEGEEGPATL